MGRYEESLEKKQEYYGTWGFQAPLNALSRGYEEGGFKTAWSAAEANAFAGNREKTLDWLEKGFEVGDPIFPYMAVWSSPSSSIFSRMNRA